MSEPATPLREARGNRHEAWCLTQGNLLHSGVMHVTVIGAGYVGLVTGVCLAKLGHAVTLVERAANRREALLAGEVPIREPGLRELFGAQHARIRVASSFADVIEPGLVLVAVATPVEDGDPDLRQLTGALREFHGRPDLHVCVRSTLPPGTSMRLPMLLGRADASRISTNPEFLRQGAAIEDFLHPSRIVIGRFAETSDEHVALLQHLYADIGAPRLVVDVVAAELIKNVANGFLALKLSFVNEIAALSEEYGVNVEDVLEGIALDPRIGSSYMRPGLGFGGSCLPKELQVLAAAGRRHGLAMHVTRAAALVNAEQQDRFARRILSEVEPGQRIALLGLSFKAGTDDLRGSPAITVAKRLIGEGHDVHAYDPVVAREHAVGLVPDLQVEPTSGDAVRGSSVVVIATDWPEFATLDWEGARRAMTGTLLFDGRNLLNPTRMSELGFAYRGVGRRPIEPRVAAISA